MFSVYYEVLFLHRKRISDVRESKSLCKYHSISLRGTGVCDSKKASKQEYYSIDSTFKAGNLAPPD
jgi:hypothetical protein